MYDDKAGIFITTAKINAGNSGGPIFDLNGNLVGVSVMMLDTLNIQKLYGGALPTSMGIGIKSNMLNEVFKYKKTIPVRNVKLNKTQIYQNMLPKVVFIAVEADVKNKK